NFTAAQTGRPELVLSSFGDTITQSDVDQYLGEGDLDNLSNSDNNLVAYLKLVDKYEASVVCGENGAGPLRSNVRQCQLGSIPRLEADTNNATVALNGAVMQMFNHGLSAAGMFLL